MSEVATDFPRITFIGFGEAGHAIASGWGPLPRERVRTYDLKLTDPQAGALVLERCTEAGVTPVPDQARALAGSDIVFEPVTFGRIPIRSIRIAASAAWGPASRRGT